MSWEKKRIEVGFHVRPHLENYLGTIVPFIDVEFDKAGFQPHEGLVIYYP